MNYLQDQVIEKENQLKIVDQMGYFQQLVMIFLQKILVYMLLHMLDFVENNWVWLIENEHKLSFSIFNKLTTIVNNKHIHYEIR